MSYNILSPISGQPVSKSQFGDAVKAALDDLDNKVNVGWDPYTPTFAGSTSGGLGNGTASGQFRRLGKSVDFLGKIVWGSTTNAVGFLRCGLPSTRDTAIDLVGPGLLLDSSAGTAGYYRSVCLSGVPETNYVLMGVDGNLAQHTVPWTWATGDIIRFAGTYFEP
jgi:hypothetical protein